MGAQLLAAAAKPAGKNSDVTPLQAAGRLELTGMDLPNLEALRAKDKLGLVGVRLRQPDCQKQGWVLCGFPSTEEMAKTIAEDDYLQPMRVVVLQALEETCVQRLRHKYVDSVTGEIWTSMPLEGVMRTRLTRLPEDQPQAVKASYEAYHQNIGSVLEALRA